jgi:LacI family transcriptional regulator
MKQKKEVRLSDIAKKLGISTVTVSKALSNKEGVGEDLRQEIKSLAQEMGYKPVKNNAGLKNGITGNIGIVIPSRFFSPNYSFYWYLFNHLSTALLKQNFFSMMELLSDEDEKNCILPRLISENKVDGIIFLGQTSTDYIEKVNSSYSNFILMDFYTPNPDFDCVVNDDFFNSYIITYYLITEEYKKMRFVGSFDATTSIRDRFMGFQKAMYEKGLSANIEDIISDRDENGLLIQMELPPRKDLPTAFVCNSDLTASKLIGQLEENGIKVPDDVSVTGYDNFLSEEEKTVPLTTVGVEAQSLCAMASEVIINKITGKPYIKGRHLATGKIIVRESVKSI